MSTKTGEVCNPVQYHYKNIPVRKYNTVLLRVDELTYKEIIDAEEATGLSIRKILSHSSKPCEKCIDSPVVVLTDNGAVKIKRGILSKRIPVSAGNNNRTNSRAIVNTETGEKFTCAKTVADLIGMKYSTLLDKLNNRSTNNTKFQFHEQGD